MTTRDQVNDKVADLKAKALDNEKVQNFLANEYVQKAEQNKILIYHLFLGFLFVGPWFGMLVEANCYAMDRPNYFWPVKEGTPDQEYFSVYNVSAKFRWIFLLGFFTHMAQLAMNKIEIKNDEVKDNPYQHGEQEVEEAKGREKKIQAGQITLFVLRVLFFLWIMNNRYSHVGRVCCGDFNGYEILKHGSNFNSSMSYTYNSFAGFIMKMFVWVFMLKFLYNGIKAVLDDVHLGVANRDDDDDGYNRMSNNLSVPGSRGRGRDVEGGSRSFGSPGMRSSSPSVSPQRGRDSSLSAQIKKKGGNATEFEKKFQDNMAKTLQAKVDGRKYSEKSKPSSKKQMQKQINNMKKNQT